MLNEGVRPCRTQTGPLSLTGGPSLGDFTLKALALHLQNKPSLHRPVGRVPGLSPGALCIAVHGGAQKSPAGFPDGSERLREEKSLGEQEDTPTLTLSNTE